MQTNRIICAVVIHHINLILRTNTKIYRIPDHTDSQISTG